MSVTSIAVPAFGPQSSETPGGGSIRVETFGQDGAEVHGKSACGASVFNALNWETELTWLFAKTLRDGLGAGTEEIRVALEEVLKNLSKL